MVQTITPDLSISNSTAAIQATVDDFMANNKSIYDQRDALKAQILSSNLQLNGLNAQIATLETSDVKKARAAIKALEMINSGTGGPLLRQFGL